MLFPENPENRPSLWDSVARQLAQEQMYFVVSGGVGILDSKAIRLDHDAVSNVMDRLRNSPVCRISASRGQAISPHFSGRFEDGNFYITEFIAIPLASSVAPDVSQLRNDLESAAINMLYGGGGAASVFVPLTIEPWAAKDVEIRSNEKGLVFEKK